MSVTPLPIVVLISGSGTNLQAIIDAIRAQQINGEIRAVISNRPDALGLQRARDAGIHAELLDHRDYDDRQAFDQALQAKIDRYEPRLVVLAGFMRILTEDLVNHYQGRMLNIHPSLLPAFPGLNTHQRVLDAGHTSHGVTVHFVTNELDSGPAVIQAVIPVNQDDTADSLARRIHQQEHIIYPMAIAWFADGRLAYRDNRVYLDGNPLDTPPRWINNALEFADE
jgi:phosphoribosylglycinamide formyltransferase-1